MGGRMLQRWLVFPLKDEKPINERLDVVEYFFRHPEFRQQADEQLHLINDLERIISKVAVGRVSPREIVQLKIALQAIEPIKTACMSADNECIASAWASKSMYAAPSATASSVRSSPTHHSW